MPEHSESERHDLRALGRAIRAIREQHGVSAGELAARCHTTLERVHELEAGEHDPTYDLLTRIADALGTSLTVIVTRSEKFRQEDETQER